MIGIFFIVPRVYRVYTQWPLSSYFPLILLSLNICATLGYQLPADTNYVYIPYARTYMYAWMFMQNWFLKPLTFIKQGNYPMHSSKCKA